MSVKLRSHFSELTTGYDCIMVALDGFALMHQLANIKPIPENRLDTASAPGIAPA
jgi:hypothetical protein